MAKILVVDDSPTLQRLLSLMLERNNHTTVTRDNGREALSYLADTDVDLVVTDVYMPEMNGLTLLEELRSNDRHRNLPIIVRTASVHDKVRHAATQKGATGFLTQPTSSWELKDLINRCLGVA